MLERSGHLAGCGALNERCGRHFHTACRGRVSAGLHACVTGSLQLVTRVNAAGLGDVEPYLMGGL